jgi:hypothetical protein
MPIWEPGGAPLIGTTDLPLFSRKVTRRSSLIQTARTDPPSAYRPTTVGTGGGDGGKLTGRLFSPLQAAHGREH